MLLSGIMQIMMFSKQSTIENVRVFDFEIDEHAMRINHYFKRKQAIFSDLCIQVIVPFGCFRTFIWLTTKIWPLGHLNPAQIPSLFQYVTLLDKLAVANIVVTLLLFIITKAVTQTM